ncbi:MAG TPA: serine/threonine-protein kinase [Polyangium sp.]|nr:serine/threonine-protein kinase [Polyangium sp.]
MAYQVGHVIDGRYTLLGIIGEGGHGTVFRAADMENAGTFVAVKCLHENLTSQPVFLTRMQREARTMGLLAGTSATEIFAFNQSQTGVFYIVMELCDGQDLESYLVAQEAKGSLLPVKRVLELLSPIVDTIEAAHTRNIVHRDIKPANIFVLTNPSRGGVRLLDFGLAKEVVGGAGGVGTVDGTITGSPSYLAPECWAGKPRLLDHRVDIFALGVVVFRMLGGKLPFGGKKLVELMLAVARGPRPSLKALRAELPDEIDTWVNKALATAADARYQSVREMWTDLQKLLA